MSSGASFAYDSMSRTGRSRRLNRTGRPTAAARPRSPLTKHTMLSSPPVPRHRPHEVLSGAAAGADRAIASLSQPRESDIVEPQDMSMKRDELLTRLKGLLPAQFEEVLFHLRIPSAQSL